MNSVHEVVKHFHSQPQKLALWTVGYGALSFSELADRVASVQSELRAAGVGAGDSVLVLDFPGPGLFSTVIAVLGLGATCILVEPWMPVGQIDHVVRLKRPKVFVMNGFGRLWGLRVPAVRAIPQWLSSAFLARASRSGRHGKSVHVESVDPSMAGMIAFSSGTSGKPKGVVRTQGYLLEVHSILTEHGTRDRFPEPDLAVFPSIGLFHITTGRGALLVPHSWKPRALRQLAEVARQYRPATLSCGPGFMRELFKIPGFESLRSIYLGGALTDCWIFEKAFEHWPETAITQIYGSTEAEPVSHGDARRSVRESREKGYFQTLQLGQPIREIRYQLEPTGAWIAGPNVCPEYIGAPEENKLVKKRDESGVLWHAMGDRVALEGDSFWFRGRAFQAESDFELEQRLYAFLQSSAAFLVRTPQGLTCVGEKVAYRADDIRKQFPEIRTVQEARLFRDRRHRARIDRARSLPKNLRGNRS